MAELTEMLGIDLGSLKDICLPDPSEVNYWLARKRRTFYITGEIGEDCNVIEIAKEIIRINAEDKEQYGDKDRPPILIYIDSEGGVLDDSFYLVDLIQASQTPVYTIATGICMSAATLILLAGKKRFAFPHSQILIHTGSAVLSGTSQQIDEASKNYKRQVDLMKDYILSKTKIDTKLFNKNRSKDWYLTRDELTDLGIVDEVVTDISQIS